MTPEPESLCPFALKGWGQGKGSKAIPMIALLPEATGAASALGLQLWAPGVAGSPAEGSTGLPRHQNA